MTKKILIVEDDSLQRRMVGLLVQKNLGLGTVEADGGRTALSVLRDAPQRDEICLVIIDFKMPEMDGIELLEILKQQYPMLPVIMLTGSKDIKVAVEAMKMGAGDFLNKPVDPQRLQVSVLNALKMGVLEKEVTRLKHNDENTFRFENLIGHDRGLLDVVSVGRKAAAADIPVLITGETGVGKEVFARAIHGESTRAGAPFVAINCGALPANLIESILFGHEKGAFTGAVSKSRGRFREAEGGTIFLDEIGELPLEAQVKLLRVLQEKEICAVGSDKAVPINVRIISATNRDLEADIENGRFRDDLFFRLNVLPLCLPALRERKADIPLFIHHFIERFSVAQGLSLRDLTDAAERALSKRDWVGNVRELENIVHRAMVLCENDVMDVGDFTLSPSSDVGNEEVIFSEENPLCMFEGNGKLKTMDQIEQDAMQFYLEYHDNNVTHAARALDMAKSTFYRKMKQSK